MRFEDLQTFIDIVEAGGMTQAATVKGVSQPGLSRTVRDLETRFGATLLRRTGRGVELTAAGAEFLSFAKDSVLRLDDVREQIRQMSGAMPQRLRIAVPPRLGVTLMPLLYRQFIRELPDVTLKVSEELTADMAEGMNAGRFDALVAYLPSNPGSGDGKPIFRESLYLVGKPSSAFKDEGPIRLAEVARYPLLLNNRRSRYVRRIEQAFQAAGYKLEIAREIETAEALLAFAVEGEGYSILPFSNIHAEVARGDVVAREIVNPPIERDIHVLVCLQLDHRTAAKIIDLVSESLGPAAELVRWCPL